EEMLAGYMSYVEINEDLEISSMEFGLKIQSILNDPNINDEYEDINEDEIFDITITGINNIEYQEYEYIFMIRFSQSVYPELPDARWPLSLETEFEILKKSAGFSGNNYNDLMDFYLN